MSSRIARMAVALLVVSAAATFAPTVAYSSPPAPRVGLQGAAPGYLVTPEIKALEAKKVAEAAAVITPLSTGATGRALSLTFQKQETNYYCVPASGRAMLSTFVSPLPTQKEVATQMNTTSADGTYMSWAASGLNHWTQSFYVYDTSVGSANGLFNRTVSDVNSYNAGLMLSSQFGHLPWRSTGETSGHAIVDYGWYSDPLNNLKGLDMWDPWDSTTHGADYVDMFRALALDGFGMVW